jgi:hypothetical protein
VYGIYFCVCTYNVLFFVDCCVGALYIGALALSSTIFVYNVTRFMLQTVTVTLACCLCNVNVINDLVSPRLNAKGLREYNKIYISKHIRHASVNIYVSECIQVR